MLVKILVIAAGGAIGAVCRYGISGLMHALSDTTFPIGTLVVNATGCLIIGIVGAYFAGPHLVREEARLFLMIGILGGFTTFSTFGLETLALLRDEQWGRAGLNIALVNITCLAAVFIGYRLGVLWHGE